MTRRLPSSPPTLPGFSYVRALGSGGFADVFLYEQNMPRRQVAVKVLLAGIVNDQVRQLFRAEANLMAQLSSHPSILTVFQSSVSSDGRPYLVMEYCSATLSQRYRLEALPVPEVLRIGIKIASAVESAHRAGVLHRDIKPSNILVTAYGHPVLSDFGIAATLADTERDEAVGLSIPWSAPEVLLEQSAGSIAAEVWSLGATLYSLLAGRSPFEVAGTENSPAALMSRISKAKVPPIDRIDVPARLELVLARALAKRPEARQHSVLELIRELQAVEAELGLSQTSLEVAQERWADTVPGDPSDHTRIVGVSAIDPHGPSRRRKAPTALAARPGTEPPSGRSVPSASMTTVHRLGRRSGTFWTLLGAAILVLASTATAATLFVQVRATEIPRVSTLDGAQAAGAVVFEWADPGIRPGDNYVVTLRTGERSIQNGTEFIVDPQGQGSVCATVTVNREGKNGEPSSEKCVDARSDGGGP